MKTPRPANPPTDPADASGHRRWWLLLPALGVASWMAAFGDKTPADAAAPSRPTRSAPGTPGSASSLPPPADGQRSSKASAPADELDALVPRDRLVPTRDEATPTGSRDLFAIRNWNPPPPPTPPAPPAPPTAPPMPFLYVGKKQDGQGWEVYLVRGDQTFIAREGQTIEGQYKVERIAPPVLTLTYLPLRQAQSVAIGEEL